MQKYDFQTGWKDIEPVIQKLHNMLDQQNENNQTEEKLQITTTEYSHTYTLIYNMCLEKDSNNSEQLYETYKKQIQLFVKDKIFNNVKSLKGEELLKKIIQKWDDYQIFLRLMTRFFSYLDKSYIEHNNLQKLRYIGYYCYLKFVHEHLKDNIIIAFQTEVEKDRNNFKSDLDMLRKISEIFVEINKNESKDANETYLHLGKAILNHAKLYYQGKFQEWSESCTCEEYISNIIVVQKDENRRFEKCLTKFTDTQKQISALFNEEMVQKYKQILLSKDHGFTFMLENNKSHVLQQIYFLYKGLNDNFEDIRQSFGQWVKKIGQNLFNEKIKSLIEEKPETQKKKKFATDHDFVERIFTEYKEMNNMIIQNFNTDPNFQMSFKGALDSFLNVLIEDYGLPEILANYTDFILKKDNLSQEELDVKLTQIIEIFNHLQEKDIYLTLFQQQLALRLLRQELKAGSRYDDESLMITKIKGCCGQGQETKNYEGMINDIKYTIDLKKNFDDYMANKQNNKLDLHVKVLQEANWPSYKDIAITLPPQFDILRDEFKVFYSQQKKNQKLNWINILGSFDIKMTITSDKGNFFWLTVSPIQLCILLQFEKTDNFIPLSAIMAEIGMKKENMIEFNREMTQLVGKKILITSKSKSDDKEKKEETNEEIQFRFNTGFTYKSKKFSTIPEESSQKFQRDIVNENREHAVEATIVRIMKSRKTMNFSDLVQEVFSLMRKFQTQVPQIKKRIESLVEREYMERDKTDINIYHYKS